MPAFRCFCSYLAPAAILLFSTVCPLPAQTPDELQTSEVLENSLTPTQWRQLDNSVDRALEFLSTQQAEDGSFVSLPEAQPAVTSFCIMAFLSRGHVPEQGPYGEQLSRAIDYVLTTQHPNGLLFAYQVQGDENWKLFGNYNHPIAGIMLGEVYGMCEPRQGAEIRTAIEKALEFSQRDQMKPKRFRENEGGWRYLLPGGVETDLSVTAWHLMFYRSARNAQFEVPKTNIDAAVAYVQRCYVPHRGTFCYATDGRDSFSRSMAGAGILSLALAGQHDTEMAKSAGRFLLEHPFDRFNRGNLTAEDRFYYGAYYSSQAMFQLGGDYFKKFYPVLLETMVENQREDGSWELEANQDGPLGYAYSTSLGALSLTPPYQLLPIYQR